MGPKKILEYKSQTKNNTNNWNEKHKLKYTDDLSILELTNLAMAGLSSYNVKQQLSSDIKSGNKFIYSANFKTQEYIEETSRWTKSSKWSWIVKKVTIWFSTLVMN